MQDLGDGDTDLGGERQDLVTMDMDGVGTVEEFTLQILQMNIIRLI